jgi:hypothetical protein
MKRRIISLFIAIVLTTGCFSTAVAYAITTLSSTHSEASAVLASNALTTTKKLPK